MSLELNTQELVDKNVVVTGGTGALGRDVVALLVERGAACWIPSSRAAPPGAKDGGSDRVRTIYGVDLSNEAQVVAFFDKVPALWASIHVAGGFAMSAIADTSYDDFQSMWNRNTASCFLCCRQAVVSMRKSGRGGRIVNVTARPALEPVGGMLAYTTSKAGVASLTECLARELAPEGIHVNAVVPAMMDTPANRAAMPDADHESWPKTSDIARSIAFLASPGNTVTSGTLLPVYGKLL